jgi:protein O-GlcNAc transferase
MLIELCGALGVMAIQGLEPVFKWFKTGGKTKTSVSGASSSSAQSSAQVLLIGVRHHQAGRLAEAERAYQSVLADDPQNFDALHLLGVIAQQRGDHQTAITSILRALEVNEANAAAQNNLGTALRATGRFDEAVVCFHKALALQPDYFDANLNLCATLVSRGSLDEAIACYERLLASRPDYAEGHLRVGLALRDVGRLDAAEAHFRDAVMLAPDSAAANVNLGNLLNEQGEPAAALPLYERAIAIDPNMAEAHLNLGNALKALNRIEDAIESYRRTLVLRPDWPEVHYALGNALKEQDDPGMLDCYRRAIELKPDYVEVRWALAMNQIPAVPETESEVQQARLRFSQSLAELEGWFTKERLSGGAKAVGSVQPFLLAYHEEENRAQLERYGALCARIMSASTNPAPRAGATPRSGLPLRIGIVSHHFYSHSVWNAILKGWFERLDHGRFSLHGFYLGAHEDDETRFARSHAARFECGPRDLHQWIETIVECDPHMLIYPEVGMDPMTARLASLRLAPVQAASWGHPETTGLPTIDYYLSAEDLEPVDGEHHYTERLIRLANLGCCYRPTGVIPTEPSPGEYGIGEGEPIFICPGVPFKYAPQHDVVFTEIARRLERCRFVFFTHRLNALSRKLEKRLAQVFQCSGMDAQRYITFVPWQDIAGFHGWLRRADVFLDTIGFSGFNTAMQAVECGLPIVTWEGRFMRGRLASGILKRCGVPELITQSEQGYVDLAVRLAEDRLYRRLVRKKIESNRSILFQDDTSIHTLERFVIEAIDRPINRSH